MSIRIEDKVQLKGNRMLVDGCYLSNWYDKFKRGSRVDFNEINGVLLVEGMFRREVDKERVRKVNLKVKEIIEIYGELFREFKRSLLE